MKRHTTALTVSLGCVLLVLSGCAIPRNKANGNTCWTSERFTGNLFSPAGFLFDCALDKTAQYTLDELEPTTTEPAVVRWDVTYAPLPAPGDTLMQPEPTAIPAPSANTPQ